MTLTDMTMREQVIHVLGGDVNDYDVPAIVDSIQTRCGTVDINDMRASLFWVIVAEHAK